MIGKVLEQFTYLLSADIVSEDGELLYSRKGKPVKIIASEANANEMFRQFHSSPIGGHSGINKTCSAVGERFYWPGHTEDIKQWVRFLASLNSSSYYILSTSNYVALTKYINWYMLMYQN